MRVPGLLQWGDVAIGAISRAAEALADQKELAERGAARRTRLVDALITAIATSPLVERVVEIQLDRVLELLEREPERIRALVRGQRDNMVGEVVGRVRAGAAAGDDAVDRLTLRWTRNGNTEPSP
ncbi:hypothetical protein [Actinoplanes xinjiangensis]|uniref:Uncharacterized protein n=1 Tax=Actinoplanes xinjiangensis TaxID=512350 RepID=A0A316FHH0_9ACTN|nr:hypothetical protein [Actinoplanes xinjiangensis]PWK47156.1 hypothetical protein BC793_108271 [Actinoplanes xinjiangensis]GIF40315.1 hypothetical protein Axi01nite_46260 [Actinoplanes xinjiangensis]